MVAARLGENTSCRSGTMEESDMGVSVRGFISARIQSWHR
jgi:hypothetical protein